MSENHNTFSITRMWLGVIALAAVSITWHLNFINEFKPAVNQFYASGENQSDFFYGYDNAFKCVSASLPKGVNVGVYQSKTIRFEQQQVNLLVTQYYIVPGVLFIETPLEYLVVFNLNEADIFEYQLATYNKIADCPLDIAVYKKYLGE